MKKSTGQLSLSRAATRQHPKAMVVAFIYLAMVLTILVLAYTGNLPSGLPEFLTTARSIPRLD